MKRTFPNKNSTARWIGKTAQAFSKEMEKENDAAFFEREKILQRIKNSGITLKAEFKGKLIDDDKAFFYIVTKVNKRSGEVTLKNENGTIRKLNAMDDFFGKKIKGGK